MSKGERVEESDPLVVLRMVQRRQRHQVWATVALFASLVILVLYVVSVAWGVNGSLCELRADLERRVEVSQQFLVDHPNGIKGIPAETIEQQVENQSRTIEALADLHCASPAVVTKTIPTDAGS